MGFRSGAYATVWDVKRKSDTLTTIRISTSRKSRKTGEYETDFSGFVDCCGTVAAKLASELMPRDRIKLIGVDVTSRYDKEADKDWINMKCFEFEKVDSSHSNGARSASDSSNYEVERDVDSGEVDDSDLPF